MRAVDLECEPLPAGAYDDRRFPDLHVLRFEEGVVQRSGRPRAVAAIVAQRPG